MARRNLIPITYFWDSDSNAMIPTQRFAAVARNQFVDQREYRLEERHDRSSKSLAHYHAVMKDVHDNLPDEKLKEYPTVEHLRKRALIKLGYATVKDHVCKTNKAAQALAAIIEEEGDEYLLVLTIDKTVRVYRPMSQDIHHMNSDQFEASKRDVLKLCADMLGVDLSTLRKVAGKTA